MSELEALVVPPQDTPDSTSYVSKVMHVLQKDYDALLTLSELVFNTPEVDKARVEAVKKEIDSSEYTISSQAIAKRMILGY